MVFESKLKELFSRHVLCPNCGRNLEKASLKTKGSLAIIECLGCCDRPLRWQTQPFVSSTTAGSLLLSAGILFAGNDCSNIANFTKATNVQIFSQTNFSSTLKKYLLQIVNKKNAEHQVDILNEVRNTEVVEEEAAHQTQLRCLPFSKVCSEEAIQKGLIKVMCDIETLDTLYHNSPLVVCRNLTGQCYRLCGTMKIHRLPHG